MTASYFLPIALTAGSGASNHSESASEWSSDGEVEWFRLSVIFDGERAQESIVLSHRDSAFEDVSAEASEMSQGADTIKMSLLDRLPRESAAGRMALRDALALIRRAGHGSVAVVFDDRDCALASSSSSIASASGQRSARRVDG